MAILESLQKIISHRNIILAANNTEVEFFGCLCYCLLQLTEDLQIRDLNRRTTWHVSVSSYSSKEPEFQIQSPQTSLQEGAQLVAGAARRVWGELYMSKRQILEDVSKVALSGFAAQGSNQTPDIQLLRIVLSEPTSRIWVSFLEGERKCGYTKDTWQLQSQLQTKLQKMTGGLSRLASRKIKREQVVRMPLSNISLP
ncbi:WD repeat and FYVE domain-containing protein 3-like, partial [Centruroides sculpturatus]|uniref:WD repeat and FYVE domain-containing protein 3-like n=1 Tax=Centruroides sculpturatus TaxID=218467 RepID=UPI000C6DDC8E